MAPVLLPMLWLLCSLSLVCATDRGIAQSFRHDGGRKLGFEFKVEDEEFPSKRGDFVRNAPSFEVNRMNAGVASGGTALDDYVWKDDSHYSWYDTGEVIHGWLPLGLWHGYILNMTSQKWLSSDLVHPSVWTHHLVVVVPKRVKVDSTVLLLVAGGSNGNPPPSNKDQQIRLAATAAMQTASVTAVLFQVPNQPTVFHSDSSEKRLWEDDIIAYTWRHFVDHADEAEAQEWPLRLPMTKAVVRAMDTIQDFAWSSLGLRARRFVVSGASKRGWTTWTTAAVDKRVVGIIPMVMDALHLVGNMHHFFKSLGGWPLPFEPYYDRNLTLFLDSPEFQKLMDIVDPFVYTERLTMPKLIVVAGNDEFFMADDSQFYKDRLVGETHFLILPNTDHSLITGLSKLTAGVHAFYSSICTDYEFLKSSPPLLSTSKSAGHYETRGSVFTIRQTPVEKFYYRSLRSKNADKQADEDADKDADEDADDDAGKDADEDVKDDADEDQLSLEREGDIGFRSGRPRFTWKLDREKGTIRVRAWEKPLYVALWYALTPRGSIRRDFRFVTADYGNCTTLRVKGKGCLQPILFHRKKLRPRSLSHPHATTEFKGQLKEPKEGFGIFFIELQFRGPTKWLKFHFTTEAVVVPNEYPFDDCKGEECYGSLV